MPDIQLRFHKDMLVLSAPVDATLARQGFDASRDREYLNLIEPDSLRDALQLEVAAGAQCVVSTTEDITQARLAHLRMDADAEKLARAALALVNEVKPQHVLAEIGPCGLPLDVSSKSSLNENRAQYANAARAFREGEFDAYFLNGFVSISDLKCALMGVAQVSDKPIFASVVLGDVEAQGVSEAAKRRSSSAGDIGDVSGVGNAAGDAGGVGSVGNAAGDAAGDAGGIGNAAGGVSDAGGVGSVGDEGAYLDISSSSNKDALSNLPWSGYTMLDNPAAPPLDASKTGMLDPELWTQAVDAMVDLGAAVVGFETSEPIDQALRYVQEAGERTDLPLLVQLRVTQQSSALEKNLTPLADIRDYTPDTMAVSAVKLYGAGVQFVRATGEATAAYTGALAATLAGLDVRTRR